MTVNCPASSIFNSSIQNYLKGRLCVIIVTMKTIAIFGAGVAGLTAAHELSKRGYKVNVYESNPDAGGFFRSTSMPEDQGMPSEYSWHGFGPWYHNVFDIMHQIPFNDTHTVYEKGLSRPVNFGIAPDTMVKPPSEDQIFKGLKKFRMTHFDQIKWGWLLFKTWTTNHRGNEKYAKQNAAEAWKPLMSTTGWKTWRATFGPWIGSDWTRVSLHHVGIFFRKNLMAGKTHKHPADSEGKDWKQGSGDGWLVMSGPSSVYWFEKWVRHLVSIGVHFHWRQSLSRLNYNGQNIISASLLTGEEVHADIYILAVNPFAAANIIALTPELEKQDQLRLFKPLISDGPHTQVSFRLGFSEKIMWPKKRCALVLADSEFNITLFAEEQVWNTDVDLGEHIESLWTGTACVSTIRGRKFGLPLEKCTKAQFIEEVKEQIMRCESLNFLIKSANNGRGVKEFKIIRTEVWHEWIFSPEGIKPKQPKWVTSTNTQSYRPTQATPIVNLLLAGAHTKTDADIWSIEGAVESGRHAAQLIEPDVTLIPEYKPWWLKTVAVIDDFCFKIGLPHILDLIFISSIVLLLAITFNKLNF